MIMWNIGCGTIERKGQKRTIIKNSTFTDYMKKGKIIKDRIGEVKLENGKIHKVRVNELTFDFIEQNY